MLAYLSLMILAEMLPSCSLTGTPHNPSFNLRQLG